MTIAMFSIGKKLQALRLRANKLSARKLAAEAGLEWTYYRNFEYRYKKDTLPNELTKCLIPSFTSRGIDPLEVWEELGGISRNDLLGRTGKDTIAFQLPDGRSATGVPAEIYTSASDTALVRYVGPGLVVIAEIGEGEATQTGVFTIAVTGDKRMLEPLEGEPLPAFEYVVGDQNWHTGTARTKAGESTCRIVLVVREVSTPYNTDHF